MPGPQGVMPWPPNAPNVSVLTEETRWPIETGHIDKLVVLHGLETSERPSQLLSECWRVLGPGGKAVFVVPNRAGLWSRSDRTPFGFGRPYTLGQLETQLQAARVPARTALRGAVPATVRAQFLAEIRAALRKTRPQHANRHCRGRVHGRGDQAGASPAWHDREKVEETAGQGAGRSGGARDAAPSDLQRSASFRQDLNSALPKGAAFGPMGHRPAVPHPGNCLRQMHRIRTNPPNPCTFGATDRAQTVALVQKP